MRPDKLKELSQHPVESFSQPAPLPASQESRAACGPSGCEMQSSLGNSIVAQSLMRKPKEEAGEQESGEEEAIPGAEEMDVTATLFVPSLFKFTTDVANSTTGLPGGWQKTSPVTLKFFYAPRGSFPEWLKCTIIVGCPLRNYLGPIDPDWAAQWSATSAIAAHNVLKTRPNWFGFNFCKVFREEMEKELGLIIDGARVTPG